LAFSSSTGLPSDRRRRALCSAGTLLALAPGAARALMAGEPPDSPDERIDPNTTASPFSGVASVVGEGGGVYTATLIAPRFVLTAAHVVGDPQQMRIHLNLDPAVTLPLEIKRALRHPRFSGVNDAGADFDLAVLELANPAPAAARRYPIYYGPLAAGQVIVMAGYGASGPGSTGPNKPATPTIKRRGMNSIARLVDAVAEPGEAAGAVSRPRGMPGTYLFIFRRPPENNPARTGSLGNAVETGLAGGDSGSPAFVGVGRNLHLMGVNSFVGRQPQAEGPLYGYGTLSGGSVVGRHLRWIWKVMNA
jgi:hypothetical protein